MTSVLIVYQGVGGFNNICVGVCGAPSTHPISQVPCNASNFGDFGEAQRYFAVTDWTHEFSKLEYLDRILPATSLKYVIL